MTTHEYDGMLPRLLLGALLALLLADAASAATTAAVGPGGVLQITTTAGAANALVVERDAAGPVLVRETGTTLAAGAGCQDRPDLGAVLCLSVAALDIDSGDLDDTVTLVDAEGFPDGLPAKVAGGDGADELTAGESSAELSGGQGADTLTGGPETDTLRGGSGDDVLAGGPGFDALHGGDGADRAEYPDAAVHAVVVGGAGDDAVAADVEAVLGGPVADALTGGAGAERLSGAEGADTLRGEGGDDMLEGGAGADAIDGGTGADAVDAGDGDDRISTVDAARDAVACGSGDDTATVDVADVAAADCEHVVVHGHPVCPAEAGGVACTPLPCPNGSPVPAGGCPQPPAPCGTASTSARRVLCSSPPSLGLTVSARRRQAARRGIALTVRCTMACTVGARAVVRVRGRSRRLASRSRSLAAAGSVTLRLRGTRSLAGRRVRVQVTARGASGAPVTKGVTVRLRRR
jgi:RTX calcium-binding nonapeptide repeat (4 copies)